MYNRCIFFGEMNFQKITINPLFCLSQSYGLINFRVQLFQVNPRFCEFTIFYCIRFLYVAGYSKQLTILGIFVAVVRKIKLFNICNKIIDFLKENFSQTFYLMCEIEVGLNNKELDNFSQVRGLQEGNFLLGNIINKFKIELNKNEVYFYFILFTINNISFIC